MYRLIVAVLCLCPAALFAQEKIVDIPYVQNGHALQTLDVYKPAKPLGDGLPVMVWIHGGGWQTGDKSDVHLKPQMLSELGYILVSVNYRLLPEVTMEELLDDVAKSIGWVGKNIAMHGGDPQRIVVGGHSAGAQLAALVCVDERYLSKVGVPFSSLRGCVPVDGDTFDIPKIIMTAEMRQALYGKSMPTFGHRQKFGNDPAKHVDFSAVTHVAAGKQIPPFLILYFSGNPETLAQAERLRDVLREAQVSVEAVGKGDSNHGQLNRDLGLPEEPVTKRLITFLQSVK